MECFAYNVAQRLPGLKEEAPLCIDAHMQLAPDLGKGRNSSLEVPEKRWPCCSSFTFMSVVWCNLLCCDAICCDAILAVQLFFHSGLLFSSAPGQCECMLEWILGIAALPNLSHCPNFSLAIFLSKRWILKTFLMLISQSYLFVWKLLRI